MQIDPHPSQHDAGLPRAVFRLQQDVHNRAKGNI